MQIIKQVNMCASHQNVRTKATPSACASVSPTFSPRLFAQILQSLFFIFISPDVRYYFMRYLFPLTFISFLAGCFAQDQFKPTIKVPQTLAHKAYKYYGLSEDKDREFLYKLLRIDPVYTEWCAAFVNRVLLDENLPASSTVSENPMLARSFLEYGSEVKEPRKGDIVVFERGEPWQGHVGFYVSSTIVNGKTFYNIIGGNQNDKVNIEPYPVSRVLSIRRAPIS
jgi:uncharacterized protein (TIGR02594 family)